MNIKSKKLAVILIILLSLSFSVPVLAHGGEPDEDETTTEVSDDHAEDETTTEVSDDHAEDETTTEVSDDHAEDETTTEVSDDHAEEEDGHTEEEDDHGEGSGNTRYVIGGIVGALLLVAGAAFLFSPRPNIIILIGLALIGATGVVHLMVGAAWGDTLLLLNGIGYLVLGILWAMPNQMIPNQKRILAIILAVYTLITIVGYFVTHDHYDFVALFTKVIEVPLLIILVISVYLIPDNG